MQVSFKGIGNIGASHFKTDYTGYGEHIANEHRLICQLWGPEVDEFKILTEFPYLAKTPNSLDIYVASVDSSIGEAAPNAINMVRINHRALDLRVLHEDTATLRALEKVAGLFKKISELSPQNIHTPKSPTKIARVYDSLLKPLEPSQRCPDIFEPKYIKEVAKDGLKTLEGMLTQMLKLV